MEQGGAGKNPDDAVSDRNADDEQPEVGGRIDAATGKLKAFHRPLQEPGDQQGEAVRSGQEEDTADIGSPEGTQVGIESGVFADGRLL